MQSELAPLITQRALGKARFVVAIAGAPGSGKSTLADQLATEIADAAVVPMDGFHLSTAQLRHMGLLHRMGAPETFDAAGFVNLVRDLRKGDTLSYPTFDRASEKTVPQGGLLDKDIRIVLVEGNYLLLKTTPWNALANLFDLSIALDVGRETLIARLVQRWLDLGLSKDDARARALGNDMKNADLVIDQSRAPDVLV
jgi:pantothenate kinase